MPKFSTWLVSFVTLLGLPSVVFSNTEIINFSSGETEDVNLPLSLTSDWLILQPGQNEREWVLDPGPSESFWSTLCNSDAALNKITSNEVPTTTCPHELWVVLETAAEQWHKYSKFTLRLSWPASFPADFKLEVYSAAEVASHFGLPSSFRTQNPAEAPTQTRRQFARVRILDTGVLTPRPTHNLPMPPFVPLQDPLTYPKPVPFILTLEPLYFGVLPPTVLPVLAYIGLALVVSYLATPRIIRHLEGLANQAREELALNDSKSK